MRDPRRLRPAVERIEAMTLLSSFAGVMPHAAVVEAQANTTTHQIQLTGTVQGSYIERTVNPDTGHKFSFQGLGELKPLGSVSLAGTIQSPGFIANGRSTGTLVLNGLDGSVTLSVTGPPQNGKTPVPDVFNYKITSATGGYKGDTGSGYIDLTLTPSGILTSALTQTGRFTMQFLTTPPPTAATTV